MDILEKIFEAGVVGAGGAGFPTHIKLNAKVEYLIINAAECEPLLYTDKHIIKEYTKEMLMAISKIKEHVNAKKAIIAIKKVNTDEINILEKNINENNFDIEVFRLDNYYPAGDEQMMVFDVTNRVVPAGGIPLEVGCVVSNVATMLNIYDAINDKPVSDKFLTVTGYVKTPMVLKVPIGISFKECIDFCGGSTLEDYMIVNGGPLMGSTYSQSEIDSLFVTKTTSGIIIIDRNNLIARIKETKLQATLNRAKSACIQCNMCTELCVRKMIGHNLNPHKIMRQMSGVDIKNIIENDIESNNILEQALICCECGVCELYACSMGLSPRQVNIFVKKKLGEIGIRYNKEQKEFLANKMREFRKISPYVLMSRVGLYDLYENKPKRKEELETNFVRIPLKQHIGAPSIVCVEDKSFVEKNQLIAKCPENSMGANIHASIDGEVSVFDNFIEIRKVER